MSCGSRIENHVVKVRGYVLINQQIRKLVKGSNLNRAGTSEPFLDALDNGVRQYATVGTEETFTISLSGGLRVHIHGPQSANARDHRRISIDVLAGCLMDV